MSESKAEQIDRVKANLPLPDDPVGGAAPDSNALDAPHRECGLWRREREAGHAGQQWTRVRRTRDAS